MVPVPVATSKDLLSRDDDDALVSEDDQVVVAVVVVDDVIILTSMASANYDWCGEKMVVQRLKTERFKIKFHGREENNSCRKLRIERIGLLMSETREEA
mmetsp:Transcript_1444/g.1786  ORF Transcript_1444/g.1786 Transcript_1444/m.1786 type:complete len:99 (+) Transcript_1444:413-709(+)|eukprot:CAMPEP_0185771976 /NCGR_PEP_ID=MMETSP1174-20130828/66308_1 /TAXON_ID=35687 /ORGANISM="Dictyocha speculum, Strain CCMP1381" /LENGTH=98 /DNA_ID=CAMNT_0028458027 /DNA_START=404 /DNA_END=700 /DNA_ORIENTATION=+